MSEECEVCKGKGYVKDEKGVHTCWKCLEEGKLNQHNKEFKDSGIKV